jgi:hypothetical protein
MVTSFYVNLSYSYWVCFPRSAASTYLIYLPTFSSKAFVVAAWDCARFNVVDFILETYSYRIASL